jgi:hypothetical protein
VLPEPLTLPVPSVLPPLLVLPIKDDLPKILPELCSLRVPRRETRVVVVGIVGIVGIVAVEAVYGCGMIIQAVEEKSVSYADVDHSTRTASHENH